MTHHIRFFFLIFSENYFLFTILSIFILIFFLYNFLFFSLCQTSLWSDSRWYVTDILQVHYLYNSKKFLVFSWFFFSKLFSLLVHVNTITITFYDMNSPKLLSGWRKKLFVQEKNMRWNVPENCRTEQFHKINFRDRKTDEDWRKIFSNKRNFPCDP